ncbi:hypothetical protein AVEN_262533-1 [Araneus ventricosus]|uniref:Uncharacterized protein n=1 Tax=Araneus ventricosus TaxID=182803 RepID=A0A4Y2T941_ARAVE|nr:hypothetical protein AVEN_262533-1 [Araneus ventricosus]
MMLRCMSSKVSSSHSTDRKEPCCELMPDFNGCIGRKLTPHFPAHGLGDSCQILVGALDICLCENKDDVFGVSQSKPVASTSEPKAGGHMVSWHLQRMWADFCEGKRDLPVSSSTYKEINKGASAKSLQGSAPGFPPHLSCHHCNCQSTVICSCPSEDYSIEPKTALTLPQAAVSSYMGLMG